MPTPDRTDWDFQRDMRQLQQALDATEAMVNKVMAQVTERTARVMPRHADDVRGITQIITTAQVARGGFAGAKTSLDALLADLTAPDPDIDDLGT